MHTRKPPIRTCTGCSSASDKREIVRFVRTSDGHVFVDPSGKANGRGAYTCASLECFEAAIRKNRLASALRVNLPEDDVDRLRKEFESVLSDRGLLAVKDGDASA
jgi:uncharacterized protein